MKFQNIPTNIITGFLGTGKTSAIQNFLKQKPKSERWAVIVNEFGEVGLDGNIYQSAFTEKEGVYIRTVPGGCMCCASGLPMHIALTVLLKMSRPHRLFIEPSGIGHPIEVMELLFSKYYKDVLDIQQTLTLLDPRKLNIPKYLNHATFKQQLEIADVVISNKTDLCTAEELGLVNDKLKSIGISKKVESQCQFGKINADLLVGKTSFVPQIEVENSVSNAQLDEIILDEKSIPDGSESLVYQNAAEGYKSIGWRYNKHVKFSKDLLVTWFESLEVKRLKAIVHTNEGNIIFNLCDGYMQQSNVQNCNESRIEVISENIDVDWTECLSSCIIENNNTIAALKSGAISC